MSTWGHVSQRLHVPVRCIVTTTSTGTTTTHPPVSKWKPKQKQRQKHQIENQPPAHPHPPFDVAKHLKSNSRTDILGLKKPTHRLAPPEVVEAARARATSSGDLILQTIRVTKGQPHPQLKTATGDNVAPGPGTVAYSGRQSLPPTKGPKEYSNISKRPNPTPDFRDRRAPRRDEKRAPDAGIMEEIHELHENQSWKSEGWGEDKLRPPTEHARPPNWKLDPVKSTPSDEPSPRFERRPPPHQHPARSPLFYDRRIEGLLNPSSKQTLEDLKPTSEHLPIAQLAHGLDRVLFNPGVHWLQDPRSRVYNFPPYLENIPKVNDFAFERLSGFIKSSRDEDLWDLAKRENRTFAGSTSSLTGILSQIYFLISGNRDVDTSILSSAFAREPKTFTPGQRMPSSVLFNYNDGVYAIDSAGDSAVADKNILTWMGTLLEKYLTMTPEEFSTYMRSEKSLSQEGAQTEEPMREAYRYAKSSRFVMRSQLDCEDKRLPGTGVFDIKTRACLPIRLDLLNFEENSGYLIRKQHGILESFEKEYYDLIRSAFLKYSFQVRIGNMDGVIVAYHNTARMFGFQYIPLEEMDQRLFGRSPGVGNLVFDKCVGLMEQVADEVIRCFPKQSIKCTFETEDDKDVMNVWVEPAEWNSDKERPIKQLEVRAENYIKDDPVRGSMAVSLGAETWTTHWSIARLSGKGHSPRESLGAAQSRQFRAHNIPTGIDPADMAEFWNGLNFGGKVKPAETDGEKGGALEAPFIPSHFREPSDNVKRLREVSRAGREETKRLREVDKDKPMWVLGETEPVPRDVIEAVMEAQESDAVIGEVIAEDEPREEDLEPRAASGEPTEEAQPDLEGVELQTVTSVEPELADGLEATSSGDASKRNLSKGNEK